MDTTTIQTLRTISHGRDAHALRFNLERALQTIDWQPSGLPPAAILCIRKLRDPLPGVLNLQGSDRLRPHLAWSQALTTTLDRIARQAVRPTLGAPPANTPAVLFLDRAELLACLARDWLDGVLVTNWWWRSLLESRLLLGQALQKTVLTTWGEAVEFVPGALHHLAQWGYATHFAKQLSVPDAHTLLQKVTHQFGLAMAYQLLIQVADGRYKTSADSNKIFIPAGIEAPAHAVTPASPWQPWAPELAGNVLSVEQELLIGVTLGLQRSPAVVRSQAFAQAMQAWLRRTSPVNKSLGELERGEERTAAPVLSVAPLQTKARGIPALALSDDKSLESSIPPALFHAEPEIALTDVDRPVGAKVGAPEPAEAATSITLPTEQAGVQVDPPLSPSVWHEPEASVSIATNYGGLFYLINLGIYLGLYADFTTPLAIGIDLNIYDFMALVGEQLVGEPLYSDPVWTLLAQLAGRAADELPGHNFTPPAPLTLPAWLAQQMLVIQPRLAAALGEDDPVLVAQLVCVHPARVSVSATRLDLYFSLERHPIQIRLSGLDRDPGWVPAAGRFVAFHFE